jgi:hypothetical protein
VKAYLNDHVSPVVLLPDNPYIVIEVPSIHGAKNDPQHYEIRRFRKDPTSIEIRCTQGHLVILPTVSNVIVVGSKP